MRDFLFLMEFSMHTGGSYSEGTLSYQWSEYLSEKAIVPDISPVRARNVFTDTVMSDVPSAANHTHGLSAAKRSSASLFIESCGKNLGSDVIFYQGSKADVRNGRKISRSTFWAKDLDVDPVPYEPEDRDSVAMVDVDYYVDMPVFLSDNFRNVFLYTFQPSSVARSTGEYKYRFLDSGEVEYVVSGGGEYRHHVWNYHGDSLKIVKKKKFLFIFDIVTEVSTFSLERRQVDEDHQVILITPLKKFTGWSSWVANAVVSGRELTRLDVRDRGFSRLMTNTKDGVLMHTGVLGQYGSCTVNAADDTSLSIVARTKHGLSMARTESASRRCTYAEMNQHEVLWSYHTTIAEPTNAIVSSADPYVKRYQIVKNLSDYDPQAKPSMVSFMKPILDGAFAPDMCVANDERCITKRVTAFAKDTTPLTHHVRRCITEFIVKFSLGHKHSLYKVDEDEVYLRQNKPQQRRILEQADAEIDAKRQSKSFMKRECYQKVADPRNISTINGKDKMGYSRFMYALAEHTKKHDWYAFGKTPVELANKVVSVCERCDSHAILTDFSRMDGRVGEVARELESQLCLYMFHPSQHSELHELMRSQIGLRGVTKFGVGYDSGLSRLSGSPETSVFNTILNCFVAYLTLRGERVNGAFRDAEDSWALLGVYAGDDGITGDTDPQTYEKCALMVGQKLTSDLVMKGQPGVKFLARCYGPDVWYGDPVSMCDLPRTLSKFHTTVTMPKSITPVQKLTDKVYALHLTDANTPIVGDYCAKVLAKTPVSYVFKNINGKWSTSFDPECQYPNEKRDWMLGYAEQHLPEFSLARFNDWINQDLDLEDLMNAPDFHPEIVSPPIDESSVVNGEHVPPLVPTPAPPSEKRFRPRKKKKDRASRSEQHPRVNPSRE